MAIRNILQKDDSTLSKKCRVVTDFNKRLHVLLDDMRETLIKANGLGLAASQVGVLRRAVIIVDTDMETDVQEEQIIELINPEIIASSDKESGVEGCLSIPGVYGIVSRPKLVKVRAQDRHGNTFELLRQELTARVICHELDHLDGVLYTAHAEHILNDEELAQITAEETGKER